MFEVIPSAKLTWNQFQTYRSGCKVKEMEYKIPDEFWKDDKGKKYVHLGKLVDGPTFTDELLLTFQQKKADGRTLIFLHQEQIYLIVIGKLDFDNVEQMPLAVHINKRNGFGSIYAFGRKYLRFEFD